MNQLESILLSKEKDEHGKFFVISKDGTTTFGRMESDSGLADVPIKLSEGIITNSATKERYELVHIEARHGEQIRNAGFATVVVLLMKWPSTTRLFAKEVKEMVSRHTFYS